MFYSVLVFTTFATPYINDTESMNLLIAIIDGIVGFIRRNPLFCLLIFLLALFAPSVLGGIAMFVLYALLGLVVLAIILLLSFRWRIYRMRKDLEDQFLSLIHI